MNRREKKRNERDGDVTVILRSKEILVEENPSIWFLEQKDSSRYCSFGLFYSVVVENKSVDKDITTIGTKTETQST